MKEPVNIDQLFQKAASNPVHTSFDSAKDTFQHSLAQRGKGGKNFLRLTKWILMITIILSGIAALTFGTFSESETSEPVVSKSTITTSEVTFSDDSKSKSPTVQQKNQKKEVPSMVQPTMLTLPIPVLTHYLLEPQRILTEPSRLFYDFANDRRESKDSVEIPELSEKEIAENDKRKRKMMKALAKQDKNQYAYIPSGSMLYKEKLVSVQSFFMQTNEVSNLEYKTFLYDLLIQGKTDAFLQAHPQEEQWSQQLEGDLIEIQNLYFNHPAYDDYPVVNVTREGAEMYCNWLTEETRNSKYFDDGMFLNDIRLPQRMEWIYAAYGNNQKNVYPWGGPSTQNAQECYLANYKPDSLSYFADGAFFTAKVGTYNPNDFGLYNMSGNVAEMVYGPTHAPSETDLTEIQTEAGTAGGGWMDNAEALKINAGDLYSGVTHGHPNIGFRVVMTYMGRAPLVGEKGN